MIKLTFVLVRRPEFTRESFQAYWFNTHAPLVASTRELLRIRRYVQMHSGSDAMNAGIGASRQAPGTVPAGCAPDDSYLESREVPPRMSSPSARFHRAAPRSNKQRKQSGKGARLKVDYQVDAILRAQAAQGL